VVDEGSAERRRRDNVGSPIEDEHAGHVRPQERLGKADELGLATRDDREGRRRDDSEIVRLQGVEGRDPGLERPHPADDAGCLAGLERGDRDGGREQLPMQFGEGGHPAYSAPAAGTDPELSVPAGSGPGRSGPARSGPGPSDPGGPAGGRARTRSSRSRPNSPSQST
jgi:hypothetical protein